jgi:hypothetical protein
MNLPPGQTIMSHTSGTPFVLLSFDISNMPTAGNLEILANTDPIAVGLGGAVDSFYNANIDNTTTQNYFTGLVSGQEDFSFETLGVDDLEISEAQISVHPNPSSDTFTIATSLEVTELVLFDILGKKVLSLSNTKTIEVNQMKAGVYMLKISTSKGSIIKKVIVE